jgi:predicted transposase YbfD/YdcC
MKREEKHPIKKLQEHFEGVSDPRAINVSHRLLDMIVITICGLISGADSWTEIEAYGNAKISWLGEFLELEHGIPSHDTFGRVFAQLDPEEVKQGFQSCVNVIAELIEGQIAIDGKRVRRSHDRNHEKAAIHMVSAWGVDNGLVIGQEKVGEKTNEIVAIPYLLKLLNIANCVITIDAMGCQKEIAKTIIASQANYVLATKENQKNLHDTLEKLFENEKERQRVKCDYHKTVNKGHGRIEIRECWATDAPEYLDYIAEDVGDWAGLRSLIFIRSERRIGEETSAETRLFISSCPPEAKQVMRYIRSHWEIENKLHWVLDMAFREDESRVRQGYAAENLAILRHLCLNLLKQETTAKVGIKAKRLKAGWDMNYLLKVLSG